MSQPTKRVSSEELLAAAQNPVFRLLSALSSDDPTQISRPEDIKRAVDWTRSYKPDDPQYSEKLAVETDYRHLGFFDEQGQPIDALVAVGRKFIREHSTDTPNCARLWRHIQAHLGKVQPEGFEAGFGPYCTYIGTLIDRGVSTVEIGEAVLKAEQDGMDVPTIPLCQADRLRLILATFPAARRDEMIETLNARELDWFPPDSVARTMRQIFKDKNYGLGEDEANAWLENSGSPSLARQIKGMFGDRNKAQTLRDLGLLDENWQWSEVGFQREQALLRDVQGKEISPSLEWLRWELHWRHHAEDPFPFSWALMNDFMPEPILHRTRRLASVALSGGLVGDEVNVGEIITPEQYSTLRKLGAWIHTKPVYHEEQNLWWLGFLARQDNLSWKNWEQICSFVYDKLDQHPDPELLRDWKDGVVTFEGQGRHQAGSAKPLKGVQKVGRNDPCPCNSGKKYKKCCGR